MNRTRHDIRLAGIVAALAWAACSGAPASVPEEDAATESLSNGGWVFAPVVVQSSSSGGYIVENVAYLSYCGVDVHACPGAINGYVPVLAQIVRPTSSAKKFPIILRAHGGFDGLQAGGFYVGPTDPESRWEIQRAKEGYVVASSAYRGEPLTTSGGRSGGRVEVCQGEITDLVALKNALSLQPYADATKVALWGESHGGCVSERYSTEQNTGVKAEVDFYGPGDFTAVYNNATLMELLGEPLPCPAGFAAFCFDAHQQIKNAFELGIPGTPTSNPTGYAARAWVNTLTSAKTAAPRMIFQGAVDFAVPKSQGCAKAAKLAAVGRRPRAYCYDTANGLSSSTCNAANDCPGLTFALDSGETWAGHEYFMMVHGMGHALDLASALRATQFIHVKMPPVSPR